MAEPVHYPQTHCFMQLELRPNNSMGRRGALIVTSVAMLPLSLLGIWFYLLGAWPVIGFMGVDIALLYGAFRLYQNHARCYETVALIGDDCIVEKVDHRGLRHAIRLDPAWLKLSFSRNGYYATPMTLFSRNGSVEIARFLGQKEKCEVAERIVEALAQWKRRWTRQ